LEAYTPKQLEYETGGPPNAAMMMMSLEGLKPEFVGLGLPSVENRNETPVEGKRSYGKGSCSTSVATRPVSN